MVNVGKYTIHGSYGYWKSIMCGYFWYHIGYSKFPGCNVYACYTLDVVSGRDTLQMMGFRKRIFVQIDELFGYLAVQFQGVNQPKEHQLPKLPIG